MSNDSSEPHGAPHTVDLRQLSTYVPAFSDGWAQYHAECASVMFETGGFVSPLEPFTVDHRRSGSKQEIHFRLEWRRADDRALRATADPDVAVQFGAIAVAAALVSEVTDYDVVQQSRKRDGLGFDYYLRRRGMTGRLFQGVAEHRLEVSGTHNRKDLRRRVREKREQIRRSDMSGEFVIVVVEFEGPGVRIAQGDPVDG